MILLVSLVSLCPPRWDSMRLKDASARYAHVGVSALQDLVNERIFKEVGDYIFFFFYDT